MPNEGCCVYYASNIFRNTFRKMGISLARELKFLIDCKRWLIRNEARSAEFAKNTSKQPLIKVEGNNLLNTLSRMTWAFSV